MTMELSIEAKCVAGSIFCAVPTDELSFERPWIIHPRTRKGLDDLVAAGLLIMRTWNPYSAKVLWTQTDKLRENPLNISMAFLKANSFPLTTE